VSRISLRLDPGLGWTKPLVVACCALCGTELARHRDQSAAARAARHTRCPTCGTRSARRLPGTTSPITDFALARGRRGGQLATADRPDQRSPPPRFSSTALEGVPSCPDVPPG